MQPHFSWACPLAVSLAIFSAPLSAQADESKNADEMAAALAEQYTGYEELLRDLYSTNKKWDYKKVWKKGKKAPINATEKLLNRTMICTAGAEAGVFEAAKNYDAESGRQWSATSKFFDFLLYSQAGKLGYSFVEAKNLRYPEAVRIKYTLNERGMSDEEIAQTLEYCQLVLPYLLDKWNITRDQ
ncbi:MAG: hypothetical protein AAF553_10755 [Pseudomonadota bacterium]